MAVEAKKRLSGSFGLLQVDGADWGEVTGVQIQIDVNYADVQIGLDTDKKMVGRSGSGTLSVTKAYSRSAAFVDKVKGGKVPSVRLVARVSDPDAQGGQMERVSINNVKFTTLDVLTFKHGEVMTSEYPFTFSVADLSYLDRIKA